MRYRQFGNTGVRISALGFGAMRLPEFEKDGKWFVDQDAATAMMHRAFDLGVNYVDSGYPYCHDNSETAVGKALKGYRDRVYVATKLPTWEVKETGDYFRLLEEQLRRLDVDYIDFYHFHGLSQDRWDNIVRKHGLIREAERALAQGLIRHISFSFHDKPEVLKMLADTGHFSSVLCQYNLLDRSNEEAIAYARFKGLGVVVMGPVGGGRLSPPSRIIDGMAERRYRSSPEIAFRFVLSNPDVCCALSGMQNLAMVEENARVASLDEHLSPAERRRIEAAADETRRVADLYCTGCGYCQPCPAEIHIPDIFNLVNYHRVYELTDYVKQTYAQVGKNKWSGKHPRECTECGQCEEKCPQGIKIREQLKKAVEELEAL